MWAYVFQEEVKGNVDGSAYIQFKDHMEKYPEAFLMSSEADVMFSYALSEKEPWRRFLFLWLCLECSHNGKQRKNLFEIKLGSTTVNNEVIRLYEIRHNLFHEGHAIIEKEDCTSLLWAIRIAICKDGTTQIAMCKLYEVWIGERYARYVSG